MRFIVLVAAIALFPISFFLYLHDILHKIVACSIFLYGKSDRRNSWYFKHAWPCTRISFLRWKYECL